MDAADCDSATRVSAFASGGSGDVPRRGFSRRGGPSTSVGGRDDGGSQGGRRRRCRCCCCLGSRTDGQLQRYWRNVRVDAAVCGGCPASSAPACSAVGATTRATSGDRCGSGARSANVARASCGARDARHCELLAEPVHHDGHSSRRHTSARESRDWRARGGCSGGCGLINGATGGPLWRNVPARRAFACGSGGARLAGRVDRHDCVSQ